MDKIVIACCKSGEYIFDEILIKMKERFKNKCIIESRNIDFKFHDGEICVDIFNDVINTNVVIVQSLYKSNNDYTTNDNLFSLLEAIRAYKEYGAKSITAVVPYLSYGRQDKASIIKKEPVTIRLIADLLQRAGLDTLITWHTGNLNLKGYFYGINFIDLLSIDNFTRYIEEKDTANSVIVSPDRGAQYLGKAIANLLKMDNLFSFKERLELGNSVLHRGSFIQSHNYNNAYIVDNAIFSGDTMKNCIVNSFTNCKINKIYLCVSHIELSESTIKSLYKLVKDMNVNEILVSNSIYNRDYPEWIKVFSIVPYIADTLIAILS